MRLRGRAHRRPVRILVTYWRPNQETDYREGRIVNLSASGCFVDTERPFPPPTAVVLRVVVGEERLDLHGEVVRSIGDGGSLERRAGTGMGVRFRQAETEALEKLLAYRRRG